MMARFAVIPTLAALLLAPALSIGEKDVIEEGNIDLALNDYHQEDPRLVSVIKEHYITGPNGQPKLIFPRNLQYPLIYGQFQQGLIVDRIFRGLKEPGFFIEAGALDGQSISNTLFLELERNWTGLLVEADPDNYKHVLRTNRNVWSVGHCLSRKEWPEVVLYDAALAFGGIIEEGEPMPGSRIPVTDRARITEQVEQVRKTIKVQCFPLFTLLLALDNPVVHYLSLDVEGAEYKVLKSLPWDKVDIRVISTEIVRKPLHEDAVEGHHDQYEEIVNLLKSKGYTIHKEVPHTEENISLEVYFIKNELAEERADMARQKNREL